MCIYYNLVAGIVATGTDGVECNLTCVDGSRCGGKQGWTSVYPALPAAPTVQGLAISVVDSIPPTTLNDVSPTVLIS
jgi:hypothetical protein